MNDWTIDQTCLVIGAGAHVPYGFPTGAGLREQILSLNSLNHSDIKSSQLRSHFLNLINPHFFNLHEESDINFLNNLYYELKGDQSTHGVENYDNYCNLQDKEKYSEARRILLGRFLDKFISNFANTSFSSIDKYLMTVDDPHETKLGKMLIAFLIFKSEEDARMITLKLDWIQEIINNHIDTTEKLTLFYSSKTKIITFNYDNLLEKMLIKNLIFAYKKAEKEAIEMVNSLNIIHVYGQINSTNEKDISKIVKGADTNLKMVKERHQKDPKIQTYLKSSKMIMFLGFGFDNENLKLLFEDNPLNAKAIIKLTNIGFDSNMQSRLLHHVSPNSVKIEVFPEKPVDCLHLIKFHYNAKISNKSKMLYTEAGKS